MTISDVPGIRDDERRRDAHDFDPVRPEETFTSAHEEFQELRGRHGGLVRSQEYDGFWAAVGYDEVLQVITDIQHFTTRKQNAVPKFAFTGVRPPLHLDPPEHTAYRRVINRFFTPPRMRALEPHVREAAVSLLDPLLSERWVDVCKQYAHRFPAYVFAKFFNLDVATSELIKNVSGTYVDAIQVLDHDTVKSLSGRLYEIAQGIIDERVAGDFDPEEDLTAGLLAARHEGEPLPAAMILGCVRQLIVTGMVAPSVFTGNMFVHLSRHPALQDALRADPSLIPAAVEEMLRLYSPYRGMARTAREDVVLSGQLIRQDDPIALVYTSANRDEKVFPDGERFILNRDNIQRHIAFGRGTHSCPGAPLARMMMCITLEEALARTASWRLTGEPEMAIWAEWGTRSVPLDFVRA
ncbi:MULTISPECIES: cytochrome P450 [Microbacterium]|uniref:Cytochrome P450 n=1 Tax=Microbacterium wangchenii TaxID=2541726 RepID=A0ABX5SVW6_9MICO|nr:MULTISPECIES: cytochrome P450 [Microbacterium]MCK6066056.1 cytochrome P450 [Microbacterium sp. EYE_512]QBR90341.1 cytochrome P450 [Microbacterium wangchenii]TXK11643.1 cytochrome P450 [Microbacterium wangchenii]